MIVSRRGRVKLKLYRQKRWLAFKLDINQLDGWGRKEPRSVIPHPYLPVEIARGFLVGFHYSH